jgi:hypothetical protein
MTQFVAAYTGMINTPVSCDNSLADGRGEDYNLTRHLLLKMCSPVDVVLILS